LTTAIGRRSLYKRQIDAWNDEWDFALNLGFVVVVVGWLAKVQIPPITSTIISYAHNKEEGTRGTAASLPNNGGPCGFAI